MAKEISTRSHTTHIYSVGSHNSYHSVSNPMWYEPIESLIARCKNQKDDLD